MQVRYSRKATREAVLLAPLALLVGCACFLFAAWDFDFTSATTVGALAGLLLLGPVLAWAAFLNCREHFFLQGFPAVAFEDKGVVFRRIGRTKTNSFLYVDVEAFNIQEIRRRRGSVSEVLIITTKQGTHTRFPCHALDSSTRGLIFMLRDRLDPLYGVPRPYDDK